MAKRINVEDLTFIRTLGRDSFGKVKLARFSGDGHEYAVKCLQKHLIITHREVDSIQREKRLMSMIDYPFVANMRAFCKDDSYIYTVMEFTTAGELLSRLRRARRFSDDEAKFCTAQVAAALAHIHSRHIVHRDVRPENVLFCADGYCKVTDFGYAKIVEDDQKTYTLCGAPEYRAPEVLLQRGYSKPVDWWSLGILMYELLVGQAPFADEDPLIIYKRILEGKVFYPDFLDKSAKQFLRKILLPDPNKRLGKDGCTDVLKQRWFTPLDFGKLERHEIPSPFQPRSQEIDEEAEEEPEELDRYSLPPPVVGDKDPFHGW